MDRERVRALTQQMIERERGPREQLLEYQHDRLQQTIRHAVASSPYYREMIGPAVRRDFELQRLPVLTKATLTTEFDRIVTDPRLHLIDAEQHLAGERAGEPLFDEYRVVGTGGTTGRRSVVVFDQSAWEMGMAGFMHALAIQGVAATEARLVGIGAPTPFHMSNRVFAELRAGKTNSPRLAVTTPLPEIVGALNAWQPEALISYPSFIRTLVQEQHAGRLTIRPKTICSVAETLTRDVRQLVRDTWDTSVLDSYCTTEAGAVAVECPFANGLHVMEQLVVLEVVDDDYEPVPAGVTAEKVLVTSLFNRALPLIRYELSDLVTVARGACPCGRPHLRLASIDGRREDVLSLPTRSGEHITIHAAMVGEALLRLPAVRQYQLRPLPDGLAILVVLVDRTREADTLESVRQIACVELQRAGAQPRELRIESVDRIERVGSGAKHRPLRVGGHTA